MFTRDRQSERPIHWAPGACENTIPQGSGNGGRAVAFDCAVYDHSVRLFDF